MEPASWINLVSVVPLASQLSKGNSKEFIPLTVHTEPPYPDFSQIPAVRILFICLFILEFLACVLGNALVCITVYRSKALHSPVNYYIVNLGICDFLIGIFVLPIKTISRRAKGAEKALCALHEERRKIQRDFSEQREIITLLYELTADASLSLWTNVWCTVARYMETVIVFVSMLTVVAICVERYYAVVYPIDSHIRLSSARIGFILAAVWIIPSILAAPNVYPALAVSHHLFSKYGEISRTTCFDRFTDDFRRTYYISLFISMYLLPLLLLAVGGYRIFQVLTQPFIVQSCVDPRMTAIEMSRRKVAKMVLVVVLTFIVCWSPYFIVTMITQLQSESFLTSGQYFFTMLCINFVGFANSCFNPIVYFVMSVRFREGYTNVVWTLLCIGGQSGDQPWRSSVSYLRRDSRHAAEAIDGLVLQNLSDIRCPLRDSVALLVKTTT